VWVQYVFELKLIQNVSFFFLNIDNIVNKSAQNIDIHILIEINIDVQHYHLHYIRPKLIKKILNFSKSLSRRKKNDVLNEF
jgi:hypothetical protein